VFRTYFIIINNRGEEQMEHLELPRLHATGPAGVLGVQQAPTVGLTPKSAMSEPA
jgi:hypothetical protein